MKILSVIIYFRRTRTAGMGCGDSHHLLNRGAHLYWSPGQGVLAQEARRQGCGACR
jgi:hypothetical protein